jgi:hypothetical protein
LSCASPGHDARCGDGHRRSAGCVGQNALARQPSVPNLILVMLDIRWSVQA